MMTMIKVLLLMMVIMEVLMILVIRIFSGNGVFPSDGNDGIAYDDDRIMITLYSCLNIKELLARNRRDI